MTKILIVDDDPQLIELVGEILSSFNYASEFITKPKYLYDILEDDSFDLILMDYYMPEVDGVTLTLERVADSPARPEARVCYEAADTDYDWSISGEEGPSNGVAGLGFAPELGENRACSTMLLPNSLEGRSAVTVDSVHGAPRCPPGNERCRIDPSRVKTFEGPWTFEFTVP